MPASAYHHGNLKQALIAAGLEILSEQGLEGLSLRNVARRVGVSHAAPYNHFPDKQSLLAAISTAGHEQLYQTLSETFEKCRHSSPEVMLEIAWSYVQFALADPGRFQLMFSGALEEEGAHPEYVEISRKNIALLEEIIGFCQTEGQLAKGKVEILAVRLWSLVHGFAFLMLENQFPGEYTQDQDPRELLRAVMA